MIYEIVNNTVVGKITEAVTTDFKLAQRFVSKFEDAWNNDLPLEIFIVKHDEEDLRELLDGDIKLYQCWESVESIKCKEISIIDWSEYNAKDIEEVAEIAGGGLGVIVYAKNENDAIAQARNLFRQYETEDALEDVEPPRKGQIVINSQGAVIMDKSTYMNLLENKL